MSNGNGNGTNQQQQYAGQQSAPGNGMSTYEKVKTASLGGTVGGGLLMVGGTSLFLKTIRLKPSQKKKPKATLMRAASVMLVAAGASMTATGGLVYASMSAIEDRPMVKALVG